MCSKAGSRGSLLGLECGTACGESLSELAPVLTKRGVSLKLKGKIYDACVQRVLVLWSAFTCGYHKVRRTWLG